MRIECATLFAAALGIALPAQAQAPMSAIDWLSDSVTSEPLPVILPPDEPASGGVTPDVITVTPLEDLSSDAVGLLPVNVTGLPKTLWTGSSSAQLAGLFARLDTDLPPALQQFVLTLLLAELDPPADSDPSAQLFLARIDSLLARGAVQQAQALLERAGTDSAPKFRRWFDASLLTGTEELACARLRGNPDLSPTLPARIFCLARSGDWNAAALTLETGGALEEMGDAERELLLRFLDAGGFEDAAPLPAPARPTPLEYRLFEAIGEPLATDKLPLAFAHADLGANSGWKAQINAAERLARSGAIDDNQLFGLYVERQPAASGGVWDRVAAIQRLDSALETGDATLVAAAVTLAWRVMAEASLEHMLAAHYAVKLRGMALPPPADRPAMRIGLLSQGYEAVARDYAAQDDVEKFLVALARGEPENATAPGPVAQAVADGFAAEAPPAELSALADQGALGAAILRAVGMAGKAAHGDLEQLSDALALFRAVGLEDVARRTGIELLLLDLGG